MQWYELMYKAKKKAPRPETKTRRVSAARLGLGKAAPCVALTSTGGVSDDLSKFVWSQLGF